MDASLTEEQRFKLVTWVIEGLLGLGTCVLLPTLMDPATIFQGTIHPAQYDGVLDDEWSAPPRWLANVRGTTQFIGWGVIPTATAYVIELTAIGTVFRLRDYVVVHHVTSLVIIIFSMLAVLSTLRGLWIQLAMVLSMHFALEWPIFIVLTARRFGWRHARSALGAVVVYEIVVRIVLWFAVVVIYSKLCWTAPTYTTWEKILRVAFPVLAVVLCAAQLKTAAIHLALARNPPTARWKTIDANKVEDKDATLDANKIRNQVEEEPLHDDDDDDDDDKDKEEQSAKRNGSSSKRILGMRVLAATLVVLFLVLFSNAALLSVTRDGRVVEAARPLRVAIVGGGIGGLAAAYAMKQSPRGKFDVTVYERAEALGGAAWTYYEGEPYNSANVEFAFKVWRDYFNLEMLVRDLGLDRISTVVSSFTKELVANETNERPLVGPALPASLSSRNLFDSFRPQIETLRHLLDDAAQTWNERELMTTSVGELLSDHPETFTSDFADHYLASCFKTYVALEASSLFELPVAVLYAFEERFRFCLSQTRADARYFVDGSAAYIERLRRVLLDPDAGNDDSRVDVLLNAEVGAIKTIRPDLLGAGARVRVKSSRGTSREYDHVIFAIKRHEIAAIMNHPESEPCRLYSRTASKACRRLHDDLFGRGYDVFAGHFVTSAIYNDSAFLANLTEPLRSPDNCVNVEHYNNYAYLHN